MMSEETLLKIKSGARVRVWEGQTAAPFEGLVLARKHGKEAGGTFTVRTTLAGVGVEKIFPIGSPNLTKVEVLSSPRKIHKSKLYFVRKASGKTVRKKLKVSV